MLSKFIPNPRFVAQWLESIDAENLKQEAAEEIAEMARSIAPVDTGEYRAGIKAEDGQVVGTAPHSSVVETGTSDTPAFAPLRRAAEVVVGTENLKQRR